MSETLTIKEKTFRNSLSNLHVNNVIYEKCIFVNCYFLGRNVENINFKNCFLYGCSIFNTDFGNSFIKETLFNDCFIEDTSFENCNIEKTWFYFPNLSGNIESYKISFIKCNIKETYFTNLVLKTFIEDTVFNGCCFDNSAFNIKDIINTKIEENNIIEIIESIPKLENHYNIDKNKLFDFLYKISKEIPSHNHKEIREYLAYKKLKI